MPFDTFPEPDLFEAYVRIAKEAGLAAFAIRADGIEVQLAPIADAESTDVRGFIIPTADPDQESNLIPALPRDQRNPRLWRNGPPGFRRPKPASDE